MIHLGFGCHFSGEKKGSLCSQGTTERGRNSGEGRPVDLRSALGERENRTLLEFGGRGVAYWAASHSLQILNTTLRILAGVPTWQVGLCTSPG